MSPIKNPRFILMLPGLVLLIGLAATYFLQRSALESERRFQQEEFATTGQEIKRSIERRLGAYEIVLHGARGLFKGSENVSRVEFREYVEALDLGKHYPGILGLGFSPVISPKELPRHISSLRKEGFSGYTVHPEGNRDLYTPIVYLEPFDERNQRAFGYDTYSEPVRRLAMERARDLDESVMTGRLALVQESDQYEQTGFVMYLPVYRNGLPHKTLGERHSNIIGWISSPYRMGDLMQGTLGDRVKNIALTIYYGGKATPQGLMYSNKDMVGQTPGIFQSTQQVNFADHVWTIRLQSLHAFDEKFDVGRVRLLQVSGTLITLMLTLLTWLLLNGRARALHLAQGMTRDLRESESALKEAQAISSLGSFVMDVPSRTWKSSDELDRLFGIDGTFVRSVEGWGSLIHPEDRAMMKRYLADEVLGLGNPFDHEYRIIRHGDQAERWVHGLGKLELDAQGDVVTLRGTIQDITARKLAEEALRTRENQLNVIYENVSDVIFVIAVEPDGKFRFSSVNQCFIQATQLPEDQVVGKLVQEVIPEPGYSLALEKYREAIRDACAVRWEETSVYPSGEKIGDVTVSPVFDSQDNCTQLIGTVHDITERKQAEENIHRLAYFDSLTSLPNRRLFMDRLKQAVAVSARGGHQGALLFIDLDNFKTINDTLGHDIGDMLLQQAAQRLLSCVREGDTVARLGGDEFMVMLEDLSSSSDAAIQAETVCEKILAALGQPYRIGIHELRSTPSIGATLFGSAHMDKEELIK